jgi:hypothetical protein
MRRVRRNRVPGIWALVLAAQALATAPAFGAQSIFDPHRPGYVRRPLCAY